MGPVVFYVKGRPMTSRESARDGQTPAILSFRVNPSTGRSVADGERVERNWGVHRLRAIGLSRRFLIFLSQKPPNTVHDHLSIGERLVAQSMKKLDASLSWVLISMEVCWCDLSERLPSDIYAFKEKVRVIGFGKHLINNDQYRVLLQTEASCALT